MFTRGREEGGRLVRDHGERFTGGRPAVSCALPGRWVVETVEDG